MTGDDTPWLVLERVDHDPGEPTRRIGTVRFAGHRVRVTLDFGRHVPGFIEYAGVPSLFALHEPSLRAVVAAMSRIETGEDVPMPHDLTGDIRDADPPFPLRPDGNVASRGRDSAALDAAAEAVEVTVGWIARSGSGPQLVEADLVVDGRPASVRAEIYAAPGAVPITRWLTGTRDDLTPAQRRAIELALHRH